MIATIDHDVVRETINAGLDALMKANRNDVITYSMYCAKLDGLLTMMALLNDFPSEEKIAFVDRAQGICDLHAIADL